MKTSSNLRKTLTTLLLGACILIPQSGQAEDGGRSVAAVADAQVYAYSYRNWNQCNWGAYEALAAGWNPTGGEKRTYLKFDLSGLDPAPSDKVKLRLYHNHTAGDGSREIAIHEVTGDWTEGAGTYHSGFPEPDAAAGEISWEFQPPFAAEVAARFSPGSSPGEFVEVDVTDLVRGWLSGEPNHGLVITALEASGSESVFGFYSREHEDPDKHPALVVEAPLSVAAVADTHVYAYSYRNWNQCNWGAYEVLAAGWNPIGGEKRTYLKFDLSGINPDPSDRVKLRLYHIHTAGDGSREIAIHEVTGDWNEGAGTYHSGFTEPDAAAGEISWEFQPPFAAEVAARFSPGSSPGEFVEVDVTDLVRGWLSGEPNHGLVITALEASGSESVFGFYSREHEDADKHPALVFGPPDAPQAPVEALTVSVQKNPTAMATLEWDSAPGERFQVLYSHDFTAWYGDLPGNVVTGQPGQTRASFTDQIGTLDRRYYKVTRVPSG